MNIIFALAWRNIWRQKRRTLLTLSAISLGLGMLIFFDNVSLGMRKRVVDLGTGSLIGDAQMHAPNYLETGDPDLVLEQIGALVTRARSHRDVREATPRIYGPVLAAMGDRAASLTLLGVDPEVSKRVTDWDDRLIGGHWLNGEKQVIIGIKLAEKLEVETGGKLVLTASHMGTGDLNSMLVRVAGVVASENVAINRHTIITSLELASGLLGLEDAAHEVVLKVNLDVEDRAGLEALLAEITPEGVEGIPWQERMVVMLKGMELQDIYMFATFVVIFLLAALGIANTMGMSILERIREFGVLQAIGTSPKALGGMVVLEYTCLGLLGAIAGFVFAAALTGLTIYTGIPLTDVEMEGLAFRDPIFPIMRWERALMFTTIFAALVPLLAVMPVRKVLKYDPATSLRFNG